MAAPGLGPRRPRTGAHPAGSGGACPPPPELEGRATAAPPRPAAHGDPGGPPPPRPTVAARPPVRTVARPPLAAPPFPKRPTWGHVDVSTCPLADRSADGGRRLALGLWPAAALRRSGADQPENEQPADDADHPAREEDVPQAVGVRRAEQVGEPGPHGGGGARDEGRRLARRERRGEARRVRRPGVTQQR